MSRILPSLLHAGSLALALAMPLAARAQIPAKDWNSQECKRMDRGQFDTSVIFNEHSATVAAANKNASCLVACMAVQHLPRIAALTAACSKAASSEAMKTRASTIADYSSGAMPLAQKFVDGACERGCPRSLPTIEQTAFGVAAAFRTMKGEVTAQQIKNLFLNTMKELSKNAGEKFEKKPLSHYEQEAYACSYELAYKDRELHEVLNKKPELMDVFLAVSTCVQKASDK